MITSLQLKDFKNFADETLRVGPFTVIVGANASGKSNIRDAFRFLHGIGRGYTLAEIIGGKYGSGGQLEWEPIRGAGREIVRSMRKLFALKVTLSSQDGGVNYLIITCPEVLGTSGFRVGGEVLWANGQTEYLVHFEPDVEDTDLPEYKDDERLTKVVDPKIEHILRRDQPVLTQLRETSVENEDHIGAVIETFANMRFLDLVPDRMRQPSFPGQTVLGDGGENLPTVLKALCVDPMKKATLSQWTRELTPMDVEDFEFPDDPDGRVHLRLREQSGRPVSAHSASDGTLRFLAMLAALLGPDPARLYFFEEIDNGIHPSRLHLLIDLIERQTAKGQTQVIATTHSPELLTMIGDTTFENTSVVCRLEDTEDAIIRPVADLPNARKLRTDQGLGQLLAGGWMEDVLAFSEENKDSGMDPE